MEVQQPQSPPKTGHALATITDIIGQLKTEGYISDLNTEFKSLIKIGKSLDRDEYKIDQTYRFEGTTDPGDEAIIYAISNTKNSLKGFLVDGYGISSDPRIQNLTKNLRIQI